MNDGLRQELQLFRLVKRKLKTLGLDPKRVKVHHRRSYYSTDRQADIVTDVSIEVTIEGTTTPALIWVWESKDLASPLSVDDVEEFHAKLEQIGADNTKGTIVVSGTLQKSALKYAMSKKIGVAKIVPNNQISWLATFSVFRTLSQQKSALLHDTVEALMNPKHRVINRDFYGILPNGRIVDGGISDYLAEGTGPAL